jgi:hypothetical protein
MEDTNIGQKQSTFFSKTHLSSLGFKKFYLENKMAGKEKRKAYLRPNFSWNKTKGWNRAA